MLEVNKKWAISADGMSIMLHQSRKAKKSGKERWVLYGYYPSLHDVFRALVNQEVIDTKLSSLKSVIEKLDEIYKLIENLPEITVSDIKGG